MNTRRPYTSPVRGGGRSGASRRASHAQYNSPKRNSSSTTKSANTATRRTQSAQSARKRRSLDSSMKAPNRMSVSVRTRPLSAMERKKGEFPVVRSYCQDKIVRILKQARQGAVLQSEKGAQHEYQFDLVFGTESTQQEIYEATTQSIVLEALKGVNCTVFAYGATGAGKTHTMMGTDRDPGIIPRALVDVFRGIQTLQEQEQPTEGEISEWRVKLSYLEVYNETIFDLLTTKQKPLQPCEDPTDYRVKVLGLTEVCVEDVSQVLELLQVGNTRRRMESTAANQVSSRSHAVIQVNIENTRTNVPKSHGQRKRQNVTTSTLAMIDLAGSERAAATQNRGARLREGANINKSLLALANCINALSSKKSVRVKYRDSKLTHLLKSSLEGNCRLAMIAAINPSGKYYEESHNTLKYANRAKDIKISAVPGNRKIITESKESIRIEELEAENQELRSRLSRVSSSAGGDCSSSFSSLMEVCKSPSPIRVRENDILMVEELQSRRKQPQQVPNLGFSEEQLSRAIESALESKNKEISQLQSVIETQRVQIENLTSQLQSNSLKTTSTTSRKAKARRRASMIPRPSTKENIARNISPTVEVKKTKKRLSTEGIGDTIQPTRSKQKVEHDVAMIPPPPAAKAVERIKKSSSHAGSPASRALARVNRTFRLRGRQQPR